MLQLAPPVANQALHVRLGSLEFRDLLSERAQFAFGESEHSMTGRATVVARVEYFPSSASEKPS